MSDGDFHQQQFWGYLYRSFDLEIGKQKSSKCCPSLVLISVLRLCQNLKSNSIRRENL